MQISKNTDKIKNVAEKYLENSRYIILPEVISKSEMSDTIKNRLQTKEQFAVHYVNIVSSDEYNNILAEINSFAESQDLENPDDRVEVERKVENIIDSHAKFVGCISEKDYETSEKENSEICNIPSKVDFAITKLNDVDKNIVCDYKASNINIDKLVNFISNYCYNKEILINACLDSIKNNEKAMTDYVKLSGITNQDAILSNLNDSLSRKGDSSFIKFFDKNVKARNIVVDNAYNEFTEFIHENRINHEKGVEINSKNSKNSKYSQSKAEEYAKAYPDFFEQAEK